jgi:hypothetical protein
MELKQSNSTKVSTVNKIWNIKETKAKTVGRTEITKTRNNNNRNRTEATSSSE